MPRIVLETLVPAPARACFDLSLSVDAHVESMTRSRERIVGGVAAGAMSLGDTVTWKARHFGLPFTMTSRISEYDAPRRFVDEQVRGPFKRWWHEHTFEESDGVTTMADTVEFASPLGPVGRSVDVVVLTRYLTRLLEARNRWLVASLS
ncbi:SRPBCC family protein [Nocardioides sp. R1-1]|uniref:SRPBCC family protein n=1 Tax=Nocardioides sp. R1-1 TaxID=3383502 RepID=UPI0038D11496